MFDTLPALYERDETSWLEAMADLARTGRAEELDLPHLARYLAEQARCERREVEIRLVALLAHLLEWAHQPDRRSWIWRASAIEEIRELSVLARRDTLRDHGAHSLADAYAEAVERASAATGLPPDRFPSECPFSLDQLLTIALPEPA